MLHFEHPLYGFEYLNINNENKMNSFKIEQINVLENFFKKNPNYFDLIIFKLTLHVSFKLIFTTIHFVLFK